MPTKTENQARARAKFPNLIRTGGHSPRILTPRSREQTEVANKEAQVDEGISLRRLSGF